MGGLPSLDPTLARLLLALAAAAAAVLIYRGLTRLLLARARRGGAGAGLPGRRSGLPAVLYFTTPDCAACKTVQRPALKRLQESLPGRLQVIEVDTTQRPDLAGRWGVLSVPTTFILDAQGRPVYANHGAARADKLLRQVEKVI